MEDDEVIEIMKDLVACLSCSGNFDCFTLNEFGKPQEEAACCAIHLRRAKKILSLRGDIVDGKFIPSESGQYAVRVVDLEAETPDYIETVYQATNFGAGFEKGYAECIKEMLQMGFARIVGG